MKKITLMIVVICLLFTSLTFARVYDGNEKIYLRPSAVSWWLNDNAKVGLYFTDGTNGTFIEALWLVDNDGGNIWSATVPAGNWNSVIVTRHSASPISWDNDWNKTGDISIDATANYIQSFTENSTTATWQTLKAHYRSKVTGNWSDLSTWIASFDTNWTNWWNYFNAHLIPNNNDLSVTIMSSHTITLNQNTSLSSLTIDNGANLVVNESKQLTAGTLTNNGTLTLKSGATALTTTISGSGTTNVEQYLSSGRQWWYLSSPVSAATSNVFAPAESTNKIGTYVEDYLNDENEDTTAPYYTDPYNAGSSTALSVGKGYVVKLSSQDGGTYTFTGGSLNNGDITIAPTRTGTSNAKRGFNLIGNPYPSYIDWDAIYNDATNPATNMRDAIWFRTMDGEMKFHTYSDGEGVPTTDANSKPISITGKIAPMQAFWVKVDDDGSNGSLTFKNTHRSHYEATGYNPLKVKAADDRQRVRLVLSDGTNTDETLIVGKSYASDSQDAYDIEKMSNESAQISEIYSMIGTETMVINSVAPITAGKTVALGIRSTSEKAYSITASQLQNIPTDVRVVLVDAEDESETELSEGVSYNFVASAGAVNNRFSIQFRSPGATTLVDNDSKNKILVYSNSQQQIEIISTESLPAGTQIRVFNAAGQNVAGVQAAGNHIHIPVALGKGVYFCHIENTNQNLQYKVIVR